MNKLLVGMFIGGAVATFWWVVALMVTGRW